MGNPVAGAGPTLHIRPHQLQAKFKHATDFGIVANFSRVTSAQYEAAIRSHVTSPKTQIISGTYRGQPVLHYLDSSTRLNVIADPSDNYVSGWKLSPAQLANLLQRGSL